MDLNSNCHNEVIQINIDYEYQEIIFERDIHDDTPNVLIICNTIKILI